MPNWKPGDQERRRDNLNFNTELLLRLGSIDSKIVNMAERLEHTNNNTKAFKMESERELSDIRVAIQGDSSKGIPGLASTLSSLLEQFRNHIRQDWACFSVIIGIMVTILGWTIFHI